MYVTESFILNILNMSIEDIENKIRLQYKFIIDAAHLSCDSIPVQKPSIEQHRLSDTRRQDCHSNIEILIRTLIREGYLAGISTCR